MVAGVLQRLLAFQNAHGSCWCPTTIQQLLTTSERPHTRRSLWLSTFRRADDGWRLQVLLNACPLQLNVSSSLNGCPLVVRFTPTYISFLWPPEHMVGHRRQRNVHQTAGKVSWLDGRRSSRSRFTTARRSDVRLGSYMQVARRPSL